MHGGFAATAALAASIGLIFAATARAQSALAGRWPLAGNTRDVVGGNDGVARGVTWLGGKQDGTQAAFFDGRQAYIEVPTAPALATGTDDFTIALWLYTDENGDEELGDLAAKFDPLRRVGWNLSLRTESGVVSNQPHCRLLSFGIDQASAPQWRDEGRPGNAVLGFSLAVFEGSLFVGTCEPDENESGRVYRYAGPGKWVDCGAPDGANAITAMAVHDGNLYVGTGKYRLGGSALPESPNQTVGGRVFRYAGGTKWEDCGRLEAVEAVGGLVAYGGRLYASSLYRPAGFLRYAGARKWESQPTPKMRVVSLAVHNGQLWAGSYDGGHVLRFDGREWFDLGRLAENTQTYAFAAYAGRLHVATWPSGRVYRQVQQQWSDTGRLGNEREVMGMMVHNGTFYAGTLPNAEVYRLDDRQWQRLAQLDSTPEVRYRRVWTMARHAGRLFCTTLPSGRVHSLSAGACVTFDRTLSLGWHHVAAVRNRNRLELHVDGRLVAQSEEFDPDGINVDNDRPLLIGTGPGEPFSGRIGDVRFYRRALRAEEVAGLAR